MAVPLAYLDGSMGYGTIAIGTNGVITINGTAFKVNSFTPNRAVMDAKDYVPVGSPGRQRVTNDFATFVAEFQLAAANTTPCQFGDTFTATPDPAFGAELWAIDTVTPAYSNEASAIRVLQITGRKVQNGSVTLVTS